MVSDVHSIASGSGLHINVLPSHVTIVTADTYPASHWMVTVDPGNLLVVGPKAIYILDSRPLEKGGLVYLVCACVYITPKRG